MVFWDEHLAFSIIHLKPFLYVSGGTCCPSSEIIFHFHHSLLHPMIHIWVTISRFQRETPIHWQEPTIGIMMDAQVQDVNNTAKYIRAVPLSILWSHCWLQPKIRVSWVGLVAHAPQVVSEIIPECNPSKFETIEHMHNYRFHSSIFSRLRAEHSPYFLFGWHYRVHFKCLMY